MNWTTRMQRTPKLSTAVMCAVAIGVFSTSLSAQVAASTAPLQLPAKLQPATRATIERLADSLQSVGVPSSPLYDKAAEGVLKGADDTRIIAAVRSLARELGVASTVMGASAPVSDIVSAASALRAGVSLSAAQKIASRRAKNTSTDERTALSFIILADFASRGVPVDAAVNTIDGLLAKGASGAELSQFSNGVIRDLMAGRDARSTLHNRADVILRKNP